MRGGAVAEEDVIGRIDPDRRGEVLDRLRVVPRAERGVALCLLIEANAFDDRQTPEEEDGEDGAGTDAVRAREKGSSREVSHRRRKKVRVRRERNLLHS